jgi:acyl-CoA synthetase (NDP forming)
VAAEAARNDLARLLRPRSIAIVGVSPEPGSIGGAVLGNLERFGYRGDIHLVSRNRSDIGGRRCLGSIDDLPEGCDVALLALPAAAIAEAAAACARRRVGAAMIYAAGFAETGVEGRAQQDKIAAIAREAGMLLAGPNCTGLANFNDRVPLTYEPLTPPLTTDAPAVAVVAQSGAMASALRRALRAKRLNIYLVVSTGNEAGLGAEDYLEYLVEDARTKAIVLFVEQFRQPQRFLAIAARARKTRKPIVLLHPGRSARARQSAATHTGALAGDYAVMAAMIRHESVVLAETIEELIDTAELLARFPEPPMRGAAIVTNSGAFKGFALDFCEAIGLDLPKPAPGTLDALRKTVPAFATVDNPLDTTGQTIKDPWIFTDSAKHLLADPAIGSLIVSIVPGGPKQAMAKVDALLPPMSASDKPSAIVVMGDEQPLPAEFFPAFRDKGIPGFRSPERALRAMALATAYGRHRAVPAAPAPDIALPEIEVLQGGAIPEYAGKELVRALGIPVPRGALASTIEEARAVAERIGYPVVLKAQAPELTHKSDAGGVIVGIRDADALSVAWERLHHNIAQARPDLALDGVLVEKMAASGLELVIGGRRDPAWGPVLMVGLGGVWIETLRDVRLLPADASLAAIGDEIGKLKAAALLRGARGQPPADIDALADALARIGALLREHPEITEIDINPLIVYPKGQGVLALDVLLMTQQ